MPISLRMPKRPSGMSGRGRPRGGPRPGPPGMRGGRGGDKGDSNLIIDITKRFSLILSLLSFLIIGVLVSPVLGLCVAVIALSGAVGSVSGYMEENEIETHIEGKRNNLFAMRTLDAITKFNVFSKKTPTPATSRMSTPPKALVSVFGTGAKAATKYTPDTPFLKLSWWPPRRVSFWVALAGGMIGVAAHFILLLTVDTYLLPSLYESNVDTHDMVQGLLSMTPLGLVFSFLGGFILVSVFAEAVRHASQPLDPSDEAPESRSGYFVSAVCLKTFFNIFRKSPDIFVSSATILEVPRVGGFKRLKTLIPALAAGSIGFGGVFLLGSSIFQAREAIDGNIYNASNYLPQEMGLYTFVASCLVGAALAVIVGARLVSRKILNEMEKGHKNIVAKKKKWQEKWEQVLPSTVGTPVWITSVDISGEAYDVDLHESRFIIPDGQNIENYRVEDKLLTSGDFQGVVVEGAVGRGNKLELVSSATTNLLLLYHTASPELGQIDYSPHLKTWEKENVDSHASNASPEAYFAVRNAMYQALDKASLPALMIEEVQQLHRLAPPGNKGPGKALRKSAAPSEDENVIIRMLCKSRGGVANDDLFRNKADGLKNALKCEWLRVPDTQASGGLELWYSNVHPNEMIFKGEQGILENKNLPGGYPTDKAGELRRKIIDMEWHQIMYEIFKKSPPSGFRVESQSYWKDPESDQAVGETVFAPSIAEKTLEGDLPGRLDASFFYAHPARDDTQTRIAWGVNVPPNTYLNADAPYPLRKETLISSFRRHWGAGKAPVLPPIQDVNIHKHSENEELDILEIVCLPGKATPLSKFTIDQLHQTLANMNMKWMRIGQPFTLNEDTEQCYSVVLSKKQPPLLDINDPIGQWLYALEHVWSFAITDSSLFVMRMTDIETLDEDEQLVQSRWILPGGLSYSDVANSVGDLPPEFSHNITIPGKTAEDSEGVYIVSGDSVPSEPEKWKDPEMQEIVAKWTIEHLMLECHIETQDRKTPTLLTTELVGKSHKYTLDLPIGMSIEDFTKKDEKIKAAGKLKHLEIDEGEAGTVALMCSREDPLPMRADLPQLRVMPKYWNNIPLGLGVSPAEEPTKGYDPFTIYWDLENAPHMLISGSTGGGKTSAMLGIAAQAISRGYILWVIDTNKDGLDFVGLKEHKIFVERLGIDVPEAHSMIKEALAEAVRRKKAVGKANKQKWFELPPDIRPRPMLILIDEAFSMLQTQGGKVKEAQEEDKLRSEMSFMLGKIGREARFVGIHIILAAQRPDAKVIPGELKENLGARLLMGRPSTAQKQMMFDNTELPSMKRKVVGRGIYAEGATPKASLIQGFFTGKPEELTTNLQRAFNSAYKKQGSDKRLKLKKLQTS